MKRLSFAEARKIDLVQYLSDLGFEPAKIRSNDYWYLSPLRQEKTPSFKVNRKLNVWFDHGIQKGGNLVNFGMLCICRSKGSNTVKPRSVIPKAMVSANVYTEPYRRSSMQLLFVKNSIPALKRCKKIWMNGLIIITMKDPIAEGIVTEKRPCRPGRNPYI